MNKKIVIAIDGFSGCGKSSTAKAVAAQLNYGYIDTGAMYRAVTLYFVENHISITDSKHVNEALRKIEISFKYNDKKGRNETYLNGLNVEDEIRKMYVSDQVSEVSAIVEVRNAMVSQQRKMAKSKGIVMDGRDIGTVVFPDAELKVFMTTDVKVRAERRQKELLEQGEAANLDEIIENFKKRDHLDTTRKQSPLRKADDAIALDTTSLNFEDQVKRIVDLAFAKINEL
ncbi:(d)CMP kinase [Aureibacter tunicatorum]|uniref:Cytidylate kinase n=1 Tax=Aureibacter tunicatorum TaxID=866807 RepID=A0AAE3XRN6_9BACT|nr:(d)CMP kinase [Aureibacter tunicatorum]MDR6240214.1 cytidylate kinase [Aureibacter tunicatorum]BDD05905.1 cytidylate kinase [Aureibacter tunicatorum]